MKIRKPDFDQIITILTALLTAALLIVPMGLSPVWNGEIANHHNQYEKITESFLHGHLYFEYNDVEEALSAMENPYDPAARDALGIDLHVDHAFYNGHFYMYYGVVPAVLVFLPYRVITGRSLTTYHATQLFTLLSTAGIFLLFFRLRKRFFPQMPAWLVRLSAAAVSLASLWYAADAPSLYCTAFTAAICCMIYSFLFYLEAVFGDPGRHAGRRAGAAFLGGLCGALAFGCRPPIALANLAALPLLKVYLTADSDMDSGKESRREKVKTVVSALIPYVVIAALLMWYNQARFGNPFEFGQAYQLTVADLHRYGSISETFSLSWELRSLYENFFGFYGFSEQFPFVQYGGVFVNFPMLLLVFSVLIPSVRKKLAERKLYGFALVLFVLPILITLIDALWSPIIYERYRMDLYYLMGLLAFMAACCIQEAWGEKERTRAERILAAANILTIAQSILLYLVPYDYNASAWFEWFTR